MKLILSFIWLCAHLGVIEGTYYYVSNTGSDYNNGSINFPFQTLQVAVSGLNPGDTLYVREGTYTKITDGHAVLEVTRNGTQDQWITIQAYPGEKPLVLSQNSYYAIIVTSASYIHIDGLEVAFLPYEYTAAAGSNGIVCDRSSHWNVTNCVVHDFYGGGIGSGVCDYVVIENNVVYNTSKYGPYCTSGISVYESLNSDLNPGYHNYIRNNIVYDNANYAACPPYPFTTDGNCIIIDDGDHTQSDNVIYHGSTLVENNVCVNNGARCLHCYHSRNIDFFNNLCYKNDASPDVVNGVSTANNDGELSAGNCTNVQFANNIVVPFSTSKTVTGFYFNQDVSYYNNFYFGVGNISSFNMSSDIQGFDPMFVNPTINMTTANFSLQASSPVRGKGVNTGLPRDTDMLGYSRPSPGGEIDSGPYQVQAPLSTTMRQVSTSSTSKSVSATSTSKLGSGSTSTSSSKATTSAHMSSASFTSANLILTTLFFLLG